LGAQEVRCSNLCSIEQVKDAYISLVGPEKCGEHNADASKLRFLCMGKELKDELFIYSYEMQDNFVIDAMLRKS